MLCSNAQAETLKTAKWPALRRQLQMAQEADLVKKLKSKKLHGVFTKQVEVGLYDMASTHKWLQAAHLRAKTGATIIAEQDGVIHVAAYCQRVLNKEEDP